MTQQQRKIIHVDMDAFYASVEMRDHPELRHKPIAVGGVSHRRGVLCTANYEARKYGVRSALPTWKALQLCPDLQVVPCHFEKYRKESRAIHAIFNAYTHIIEPLSLDEAFLDVTDCKVHGGSATLIADAIRKGIEAERRLTASAGIAPNKFLAKIASDWNKPNGQFTIAPGEEVAFLHELPVRKIFGVGRVTADMMERKGVYTCGDLREMSLEELEHHFGSRAGRLYELARGIDHRPVEIHRDRKSLSVEETYAHDLVDLAACIEELPILHERLLERLERMVDRYRYRSLFVKVKFKDFTVTTVEDAHLQEPLIRSFETLLEKGWHRQEMPVRLIGLGVGLAPAEYEQLTLW